ncbi:hypothetical protein Slin14017_G112870 [Septoria linicola]|nr:hypothetical protein Slin14017_G112870 [Septoria linicola]
MAKLQMLFMALACLAANVCANCNKPDSCYTVITNKFNWDTFDAATGGQCPDEVLKDCDAACCSTYKKRYWRNGVEGDHYFGVGC